MTTTRRRQHRPHPKHPPRTEGSSALPDSSSSHSERRGPQLPGRFYFSSSPGACGLSHCPPAGRPPVPVATPRAVCTRGHWPLPIAWPPPQPSEAARETSTAGRGRAGRTDRSRRCRLPSQGAEGAGRGKAEAGRRRSATLGPVIREPRHTEAGTLAVRAPSAAGRIHKAQWGWQCDHILSSGRGLTAWPRGHGHDKGHNNEGLCGPGSGADGQTETGSPTGPRTPGAATLTGRLHGGSVCGSHFRCPPHPRRESSPAGRGKSGVASWGWWP